MSRGYVRISDIRMEPVVEIEASTAGGYASGITTWEASLYENLTDAETDRTLELVSLCEERQTYDDALAALKARLDELGIELRP